MDDIILLVEDSLDHTVLVQALLDYHGLGRHVLHHAAARGPGVLNERHGMQVDQAGGELAIRFR